MKSRPSNEPLIVVVRNRRVVLDFDLAAIYGVETRALNQAIKRNRARFPSDFAFQLTGEEFTDLKSHFVTSSGSPVAMPQSWVQSMDDSHGGRRKLPWAFTEHGALMAANVLRSARAVEMSVYVVRAFVRQREQLATSAEILKRLAEIDRKLLEHDDALVIIWKQLKPLLLPPPSNPKPRIGFHS
jgi:hypothetical protein